METSDPLFTEPFVDVDEWRVEILKQMGVVEYTESGKKFVEVFK